MNTAIIVAIITGLFSVASIFITFGLQKISGLKNTKNVISEVKELSKKVGDLDGRVSSLDNRVSNLDNRLDQLAIGTQQLLRYNLTEIYETQKKISDGKTKKHEEYYVPEEITQQFDQMFDIYHKLGANGVMDGRKQWMDQHKEPPKEIYTNQEV